MVMSMAAESFEVRMARLEGASEQIDRRLGALEAGIRDLRGEMVGEFGSVRGEFGNVRQEIRDLRGEVRQQFHWVIGLIVVTLLVPIALRFLPP